MFSRWNSGRSPPECFPPKAPARLRTEAFQIWLGSTKRRGVPTDTLSNCSRRPCGFGCGSTGIGATYVGNQRVR